MESFVRLAAPIVIALVGLVVFWGIARMVMNRKDNESESKDNTKDNHSAGS